MATQDVGPFVNARTTATLASTDLIPVVQSSVTKKSTLAALIAFVKLSFDAAKNFFVGGGGGNLTTGAHNVGIGAANATTNPALNALTSATDCVALGDGALASVTTGANNVGIGSNTLTGVTTGASNTGIGLAAAFSITTGIRNTAAGGLALAGITTGSDSVGIGYDAGFSLTTGNTSVFVGFLANTSKATIVNGIAIGANATVANNNQCVIGATGSAGVTVGFSGATAPADADIVNGQGFLYWAFSSSTVALKFKGKASDGTVVSATLSTGGGGGTVTTDGLTVTGNGSSGDPLKAESIRFLQAVSGSITVATNASPIVITSANHNLPSGASVSITGVGGNNAANATWIVANPTTNTFELTGSTGDGAYTSGGTWELSGFNNIFLGANAGNYSNTSSGNIGIGIAALQSLTSGNTNIAVGQSALTANTTGSNNVVLAVSGAMSSNTTGSNNIALGLDPLDLNVSGSRNVAIGYYDDNGALGKNTTGTDNIGIGVDACDQNTTGTFHVALGANAGPTTGALTNTVCLGKNATTSASNTMAIGGTSGDAVVARQYNGDALVGNGFSAVTGLVQHGLLTAITGTITGATNANPIVVTSTAHGLNNGARVTIAGVGGNTAANTTATVANKTTDTFELAGVAGNGAYTSGGTWTLIGQTGNISTTTIFTAPASPGLYLVTVYQYCKVQGSAGTLAVTLGWTDSTGAQTTKPAADTDLSTTGNLSRGVTIIETTASAITFATAITGGSGSPVYGCFVTVQRLL